jgi:hypothetical protein
VPLRVKAVATAAAAGVSLWPPSGRGQRKTAVRAAARTTTTAMYGQMRRRRAGRWGGGAEAEWFWAGTYSVIRIVPDLAVTAAGHRVVEDQPRVEDSTGRLADRHDTVDKEASPDRPFEPGADDHVT